MAQSQNENGRYLSAEVLYAPTTPGRCLMFTKFQAHQRTAVQGTGRGKVTTIDRVTGAIGAPIDAAFRWYMGTQTANPALVAKGLMRTCSLSQIPPPCLPIQD